MRLTRLLRLASGLAVLAAALILPSTSSALEGPPAQVGQWGSVLSWGVQAKHMTLLNTGKVLVWSQGVQARIWDPATGAFQQNPAPFGDVHCAGQVTLADGRVLVVGGQNVDTHVGIPVTSIFDPRTNSWTRGRDMAFARWYPTLTTLADGRALVTSGDQANSSTRVDIPEIYDPVTDTWATTARKAQYLYPFMYQLANGKVFEAGTRSTTAYLDVAGAGAWTPGPTAPMNTNSYSESGAMYDNGKILRAGGGDPASGQTAVIDMGAPIPAWRLTSPLNKPRRRMNTPILLDGTVMAVGGASKSDDENTGVLSGEIWNPATQTWSEVASMTQARMYHSTALTLPDGRVVVGGGEGVGKLTAQVYSPPYLFKGPRPVITDSPASSAYNAAMTITTDSTSITKVALLRPSAVTHAIDMNQRYVPLSFTQSGGTVTATAPPTANHAPPGYYMLVVVDANGVPSVAKWVLLGGTPTGPGPDPQPSTPPVADFGADQRTGTTSSLAVNFTDASTGATTWAWDFESDGVVDSTQRNPSHAFGPGTYTVTLRVTNAAGQPDTEVKPAYVTVTAPAPGPDPDPDPDPVPGDTQTLAPVADAYVSSKNGTKNYGTATTLRLRHQATGTPDDYLSYLKFNLGSRSAAPAAAKLRLWVTDASPDGGSLYKVSSGWTETGITWNAVSRPPVAGTSIASAGATVNGRWVEFDVTAAMPAGGDVSFALQTTSSNSSYYASREAAAAMRPQLVLSGGSTTPPPTGGAPVADFSAASRTGTGSVTAKFTDASTGAPTSWSWDFDNDGTVDSTEQEPTHTYGPGTYTVKLTVGNAQGSDDEIKTGYIVVGTPGSPGATSTFTAVADAHVKSNSPTKNYGKDKALQLRQGTASSPTTYRDYLRFDVTGVGSAPTSAKLRLWVTGASTDGGSVFAAAGGWTETGITWSNAPATTSSSLASAGSTATGTWVELDVTAAVAGDGPVDLMLSSTSSKSATYASREEVLHAPQLVVTRSTGSTLARAAVRRTHLQSMFVSSRAFLCPLERGH